MPQRSCRQGHKVVLETMIEVTGFQRYIAAHDGESGRRTVRHRERAA